jgi:peptidoglycan hydrolase-like protein with peptidoglycan-binding domain
MPTTAINAPGFDTSEPLAASVAGLQQAGVQFVGKYIASKTSIPGKIATPTEAVELAIAGIPLFAVYEGPASASGTAQGSADGAYAAQYLPSIGLFPNTGVVVYYGEDIDVPDSALDGIGQALKAFGAALPGYEIGSYSCGSCNSYLYQQGLISKKWLSASTTYNGTPQAIKNKDYDIFQGQTTSVVINNCPIDIDPDILGPNNPDIGARIPWNGAIPQNAPLSILAVQMLLNKAGQTPPLVTDGESGPNTDAAIIASKKSFGLPQDTTIDWTKWVPLLCNAAGVKIFEEATPRVVGLASNTSVMARLALLENMMGESNQVTAHIQRVAASGVKEMALAGQLQNSIDSLSKLIAQKNANAPAPLGEVNGALGNTLGNILNGKKSAIGIIGAMMTSILSQVPPSTGLGQVLGSLTPSFGLSPYAMPIFLAIGAWGILGKLEKWSQQSSGLDDRAN